MIRGQGEENRQHDYDNPLAKERHQLIEHIWNARSDTKVHRPATASLRKRVKLPGQASQRAVEARERHRLTSNCFMGSIVYDLYLLLTTEKIVADDGRDGEEEEQEEKTMPGKRFSFPLST